MTRRQKETAHQRKCIKDIGFTTKFDGCDYKGAHNGHEIIIEHGDGWVFVVDGVQGQEEHDTKISAIWWALVEINAF